MSILRVILFEEFVGFLSSFEVVNFFEQNNS